jgi:hypothetical protein
MKQYALSLMRNQRRLEAEAQVGETQPTVSSKSAPQIVGFVDCATKGLKEAVGKDIIAMP